MFFSIDEETLRKMAQVMQGKGRTAGGEKSGNGWFSQGITIHDPNSELVKLVKVGQEGFSFQDLSNTYCHGIPRTQDVLWREQVAEALERERILTHAN